MKTNRFLLAVLGVASLLFTACKDEVQREESPADEGKYQVFIYAEEANTTSYTFLPGDTERNVAIKLGRCITTSAIDVPMDVTDPSNGVLIYNDTVSFAAGVATSEFVFNLDSVASGKFYSVTLTVPEEYASLYGMTTLTLKLGADYTWISKGSVKFNQDFLSQDVCDVAIEYALEYEPESPEQKLFRLNDPFYEAMLVTYPDEVEAFCTRDCHLEFLMDTTTWDLVQFVPTGWNKHFSNTGWDGAYIGAGTGPLIVAVSEAAMSSYGGSVTRKDNAWAVSTVIFSSGSGSGWYFNMDWTWDNGYPGVLSDPMKGDGAVDTLYFDDATTIYPNQDVAYWANEDFEEKGYHNSYDLYTVNGDGIELRVFLSADTIIGTFTFANVNYPTMFDDDHWTTDYYGIGNFVAFPGFYSTSDDMVDGSYIILPTPLATHYLRTGTVDMSVDEDNPGYLKAVISAKTGTGAEFNCVVTNIEVDGMDFTSPAPARRVKFNKRPTVEMSNF